MEQTTAEAAAVAEPAVVQWGVVLIAAGVAAILSWVLTEALKQTVLGRWKYKDPGKESAIYKRRMWWSPMLWVVAALIGSLLGLMLGPLLGCTVSGVIGGACGGALSAWVVEPLLGHALCGVKAWINKKLGGGCNDKEPPK